MNQNIMVALNEEDLTEETIALEGDGFDWDKFDDYERVEDFTDLMVWVRRDTGVAIFIELDCFRSWIETALEELRENPLPWTFTLESLGIKEKPLEDVLLAVWEKYKDIKMVWD